MDRALTTRRRASGPPLREVPRRSREALGHRDLVRLRGAVREEPVAGESARFLATR
ncbi:hypothetical protein ACVU7I_00535 [Patulibacter sp. S7RM1-6]